MVARMAHQMAIESEHVTADVVEVGEFPDLAQYYAITGVPKIIINDRLELLGSQPESTLVRAVLQIGNGGSTPSS